MKKNIEFATQFALIQNVIRTISINLELDLPNCVLMEQQSTGMHEVIARDAETCENWLEKLFDNFNIVADVMKVKFEQKCNLVNSKQERIFELENVLKRSVKIASERENEYHQLVQVKEDMDVKVN